MTGKALDGASNLTTGIKHPQREEFIVGPFSNSSSVGNQLPKDQHVPG